MRIVCFSAILLALSTSVSLAADAQTTAGIVWSPRGAVLTRVDAVSRMAVPGAARVLLGHAHYAVSTSPDGALMASASGIERRVVISDLKTLGRTWTIGPLSGQIQSTYWLARRTLAAVLSDDTVTLLDVNARTAGAQIPVGGVIVSEAATAGRYVALVAPGDHLGALHLVWVGNAGQVRRMPVPALRGGWVFTSGHSRFALPGIALSPSGKLAYVVARGNRIVVANLTTGRVRAVVLRANRTLQSAAKLGAGWQRTSALLGSGLLVTTGGDLSGREYGSVLSGTPAGLRLTNLRTRRTRVAVPGVNQFRICGGLIVAARSTAEAASAGVVALDRNGLLRWSQFTGQGALLAGCSSRYVYLEIPGGGVATLDARTGAVLDMHRGSAATVIASPSPV